MVFKHRDGSYELEIFRHFKIDKNLKKHKKQTEENNDPDKQASIFIGGTFEADDGNSTTPVFRKIKKSFLNSKIFSRKKPVKYFFKAIFENAKQVEKFNADSKELKDNIEKAQKLGQTALVEKFKDTLTVKLLENQLVALDSVKYISEQDLIKFVLQSEKGISLTYISNFTKIIPDTVADKKDKMDDFKIFDNYAILHYDPEGSSINLTKKEIEKKRDPILFGLIKDSRNLYFIDDWKDNYCDLTFDKLVDFLGDEKITLTAKTKL